jgi:hypothetical protein
MPIADKLKSMLWKQPVPDETPPEPEPAPNLTSCYEVSLQFGDPVHRTDSLEKATVFAAAAAFYSGQTYVVCRINQLGNEETRINLGNFSPTHWDYRRTSVESQLIIRAMAHELVPGIEQWIKPKNEGPIE